MCKAPCISCEMCFWAGSYGRLWAAGPALSPYAQHFTANAQALHNQKLVEFRCETCKFALQLEVVRRDANLEVGWEHLWVRRALALKAFFCVLNS